MKPFSNLENKIPSDTYLGVKLVCMKDQALSFSETPFEYNQDQMLLKVQGFQKLDLNTTVVHLQTC